MMRLTGCLGIIIFFTGIAHNAYASIDHLSEGGPGCWQKIRPGALTRAEVKQLGPECQEFRNDYFAALQLAEKSPQKLEKKIIQALKNAKQPKTPYEAIFFANLVRTDAMKEALKSRAEIEAKLKVPFRYAEVASYLNYGKECIDEPQYAQPFYFELCTAEDSLLPAFFEEEGTKK